MRNMRTVTILGAAMLAALFFAGVSLSRTGDPHKQVALTASSAIASVRAFGVTETLSVSGPVEGKGQLYYQLRGDHVSADVDANDGTVRTLTRSDTFPTTAAVKVSSARAAEIASSFIAGAHVPVPAAAPTVRLLNHGDAQEYLAEWQSRINGVLVPDYRSVSVNPATGAVFGYTNLSLAFSTPGTPGITEDQAGAIALQTLGSGSWVADSVDLEVTFNDSGDQQLSWVVSAHDSSLAVAVVTVDAQTGSASVTANG